MSGGKHENVMSSYNDEVGDSGFDTMPESKYYDKYTSNNVLTACNGRECLSHGLSETMMWYGDFAGLSTDTYPGLARGGNFYYTVNSGAFYYYFYIASNNPDYSFRLAMSMTNS